MHLLLPSVTITLGSVTERGGDVWWKSDRAISPRRSCQPTYRIVTNKGFAQRPESGRWRAKTKP
jgi:hypothetical protein